MKETVSDLTKGVEKVKLCNKIVTKVEKHNFAKDFIK